MLGLEKLEIRDREKSGKRWYGNTSVIDNKGVSSGSSVSWGGFERELERWRRIMKRMM